VNIIHSEIASDKLLILMINHRFPNEFVVGVNFRGESVEHEVSLVSAASVINALDKEKYDVIPIGIASTGQWLSSNERSAC